MHEAREQDLEFWLDQMDLTSGLEIRATLASHPTWGSCLRVASSCPSGPLETRVSPHGWKVTSRGTAPQLPAGWSAKRHREVLASTPPASVAIACATGDGAKSRFALLSVYHHTGDERDLLRLTDPLRAFKELGLAEFDGFEKFRTHAPWASAAPQARAVKMVPLDRLGPWIERLDKARAYFESVGRPAKIDVFFEDQPLESARALSAAGRGANLRGLGSFQAQAGRRVVAGDPGQEGRQGARMALKPGAYQVFCASEGGELRMLALLSNACHPSCLLDDARWSSAGRVFASSGMVGFFQEPQRAWPAGRLAEVSKALEIPGSAKGWAWGACAKAPQKIQDEADEDDFDGADLMCEAIFDEEGHIIASRLVIQGVSETGRAQLREMAGARPVSPRGASAKSRRGHGAPPTAPAKDAPA